MFDESKLDSVTVTAPVKPPERREIHIWPDRRTNALRIDPRGTIDKATASDIIDVCGFPLIGPCAQLVEVAARVCEKHGWTPFDAFLDEGRDLHIKMWKDATP